MRPGAIRDRSESSQVARGSFDLGRIAVTIAYPVATVYQHGRAALAVPCGGGGQTKDAERRDKEERSSREGHEVSAGPVKTFRKPAMSKKHRWPMDEGNLRVKRRALN